MTFRARVLTGPGTGGRSGATVTIEGTAASTATVEKVVASSWGRAARKLRRGGVDLLAGRALLRTLHPFMAAELPGFRLDDALEQGLLSLVVDSPHPSEGRAAYASLYLEQEAQLEGWARDVGDFARFLEAISFSHGSVLNVASVARECAVQRNTVVGYIEVREDLLLSYRLPVFTRRARRQTSVHPKLYLPARASSPTAGS